MSDSAMIQTWLQEKIAELLFVEPEVIDVNEPFVNYGLGSADAVELSGELEEWLEQKLSRTLFFDYPSIAAVADYLVSGASKTTNKEAERGQGEAIAVIGIGCRFPGGANTPENFWELLKVGFDAIIDVPANRWDIDEFYSPDPDAPGKMYTRTGGFLPDVDQFDPAFFEISPREAVQMHPQQRMLLEVAWEAFENAGQKVSALAGSNTGVFVGLMNMQDYAQLQIQSGDPDYMDNPYFVLGNSSNIAAGRLSYLFDFQGPNLTTDSACSSSLVATHLACQSLRQKECDLAVAGGVSTYLLPEHVVNGCKIRMLSQTGRCRTFDARADGSIIGEGCGMIVLKRLSDALASRDTILAVIRGSAVNQDGRSNGITAPNKHAQEAVIRQALANAGLEAHRVSYVEAHGSGTPLGDPIEVEALATTLGQARSIHTPEHPLIIGSVKTNIGHLAGAAGIAGLIKTVLALQHKEIPPHLHLKEPNPYIPWNTCPITIPTEAMPWPSEGTTRIAGVSSYGWSGTNAHILLEEGPTRMSEPSSRKHHLLLLSAKTESALERATDNLLAYFKHHPESNLADVAYTLQVSRDVFAHRRMLLCQSVQDALSMLEQRTFLTNTSQETAQEPEQTLLKAGMMNLPSLPEPEQAALLTALGKLWLAGTSLDWQNLYVYERRTCVPLPTYPFERQRYWIESATRSDNHKGLSLERAAPAGPTLDQAKREKIEDWFYLPGWKTSSPYTPDHDRSQAMTGWVFFLDDSGIGTDLIRELHQHAAGIIVVTAGQTFNRSSERAYTVQPTSLAHYEALFKDIRTQGYTEIRIVHLWTITDGLHSFETAEQKGFYSILALVQALENLQFDACHISIVSNGIQDVVGNEVIYPEKATILGPCLVIPFEYPDITCRSIDITVPETDSWQREALLYHLLGEITSDSTDAIVALRGNHRWIPVMDRLRLAQQTTPGHILREHGVYLITGGLGGIGLAMAEYLARTVRARLILVSRSGLPPREEWSQLRATHTKESGLGHLLHAIEHMEELGAQVLPLQADVTNKAQMQAVIGQTLATFGALHGVLHAAGLPGIGLMQLKTPEQAARVLAPKVQGTLVLEQVLAHLSLDFLVLFSSITSSTGGGPGQMDYSAANAFLDAYAHRNHNRHGRTIAIDWGEWQWNSWEEGLTGHDNDIQTFLRQHRQSFGITFEEGTDAFARLLASRQPRVVVSTQDFQAITELLKSFTATRLAAQHDGQTRPKYPRPTLTSSYTPPRNDLEQAIVSLWEELLGIAPVGIHDNFFELGGNSLVGINLIARMRKTLQLEAFPAYVLYEASSVSNMAQYIEQGQKIVVIKERLERGEKRRAGLSQRLERRRK